MRYHEHFWTFSWQTPKQLLGLGITHHQYQGNGFPLDFSIKDSMGCVPSLGPWALFCLVSWWSSPSEGVFISSYASAALRRRLKSPLQHPLPVPLLLSSPVPLSMLSWPLEHPLWLSSSPRLPGYVSVPTPPLPLLKSQNLRSWIVPGNNTSCFLHGGWKSVACTQNLRAEA